MGVGGVCERTTGPAIVWVLLVFVMMTMKGLVEWGGWGDELKPAWCLWEGRFILDRIPFFFFW
jgi:hypothetical protein